MGSGGGGQSQPENVTSTTVSELPDFVEPHSKRVLNRAQGLSELPFQEYSGQRVSGLNPYQLGAADITANRAIYGDPGVEASRSMIADTASGVYANNPLQNAVWDRAADQVQQRHQTMTQGHQGLTNTGYAQQSARDLNDLAAAVYGQERAYQNQAPQQALALGQEPYQSAQALAGAGDVLRNFDQDNINEAIRSFEAQRLFPYQQLDAYGRAVGMGMGGGGSTVTTQPGYFQASPTAGMLGGGLAGYGIGQQSGHGLAGAGLGALGGYLLS